LQYFIFLESPVQGSGLARRPEADKPPAGSGFRCPTTTRKTDGLNFRQWAVRAKVRKRFNRCICYRAQSTRV